MSVTGPDGKDLSTSDSEKESVFSRNLRLENKRRHGHALSTPRGRTYVTEFITVTSRSVGQRSNLPVSSSSVIFRLKTVFSMLRLKTKSPMNRLKIKDEITNEPGYRDYVKFYIKN